jgi:uncharacterized protein (DUF433 family)
MANTTTNHIEIRKNRDDQPRAFVQGTRIRVLDIYVLSEVQGKTPDEIVAAFPHLTLAQVHAALAYYFDNMDAIGDEMRHDEDFVLRMRAHTGPGPLEAKLKNMGAAGDSVSS